MLIELNLIAVPELQGEPEDIAKEKCKIAAQSVIIPSCHLHIDFDYCVTMADRGSCHHRRHLFVFQCSEWSPWSIHVCIYVCMYCMYWDH